MSSVTPPTVSNTALLKGVATSPNTGSATGVPPGILSLPSGTVLRGIITQIDGRGNAVLNTTNGNVALQTDLAIKLGSEVALRLTASSQGIKARILTVNGMTPKDFAEKSAIPRGQQIHVDDIVQTGQQAIAAKPAASNVPIEEIRNPLPTEPLPPAAAESKPLTEALPLRGVLLQRAENLPQILQQLPTSISLPVTRLEVGANIAVKLVANSLQFPATQPTATVPPPVPPTPGLPGSTPTTPPNVTAPTVTPPTSTSTNPTVAPAATTASTPPVTVTPAVTPTATTPFSTAAPTIPATPNAAPTTPIIPTQPPAAIVTATVASLPPATQPGVTTVATPTPNTTTPAITATSAIPETPAASINLTTTPTAPTINLTTTPQAPQTTLVTTSVATTTPTQTATPSSPPATPLTATTAPVTSTLNAPTPNTPLTPQQVTTPTAVTSSPATTTTTVNELANPQAATMPTATTPSPATPNTPNIALPAAHLPAPQPSPVQLAQGQIPAVVIGHEQSGETVVKTVLGTVKLSIPTPSGQGATLPVGTQFNLQLEAITQPKPSANMPLAAAVLSSAPAPLSELSMNWRGLREAIEVIAQTQPQLAAQIIDNVIPKPGPKMASAMLFFVSALRGGDVRQWLGDRAIEILEQSNRGDLVKKLSAEFGTLRQFFVNSPSPNWQAVFVPVHDGMNWQQARLFVKKEPQGSAAGEKIGTRFIMEVELSRMGPMQFDGLVRKRSGKSHFDLIIRSRDVLSAEHQQNIRDIYQSASDLTGFIGGLSFQTVTPFPVLPMRDILSDAPDVMA